MESGLSSDNKYIWKLVSQGLYWIIVVNNVCIWYSLGQGVLGYGLVGRLKIRLFSSIR